MTSVAYSSVRLLCVMIRLLLATADGAVFAGEPRQVTVGDMPPAAAREVNARAGEMRVTGLLEKFS